MPTTDTPTADGLRAALALIDKRAQAYDPKGCGCPCEHCGQARAVFAVARAAVARDRAWLTLPDDQPNVVYSAACLAYNAAIADLVRLATGAQGGEA